MRVYGVCIVSPTSWWSTTSTTVCVWYGVWCMVCVYVCVVRVCVCVYGVCVYGVCVCESDELVEHHVDHGV